MTNFSLRLLLILCCPKAGYAIGKFNLFHHCDKKISMVGNAVKDALLFYQDDSMYSDGKDPCIVELRGWYDNRIAMHFRYFYLDRMKTSIEIRQGKDWDDWTDARPISGLPKILNSSTFDNLFQVFTSDGVGLFIAIHKPSSRFNIKLFEMALNVFHTGNCKSWEYSCDNGWCIDEDIKCSGYFPCGDYSDCRTEVSGGLIAGIIVGSIVVASIVLAVGCYYVRRHWRKRMREREQTGNNRYSWSPPDTTTQGDTYTDNTHGYRWNNNDHSMNNLFDDDSSPSLHQGNRHSPSLNRTNRQEPPNYNSVVAGNDGMGSRSNTNERQGPEPSAPSLGPEFRAPSLVPQLSAPRMDSEPNVPSEQVVNSNEVSDLPSYNDVLENQDAYRLNLPGDKSTVYQI